MGETNIKDAGRGEPWRLFLKRLVDDLHALERMLQEGSFETGVSRIGAEQELFLAGEAGRPVSAAMKVLEITDDPHAVTELALFNLEINLDPLPFSGHCLTRMQKQLEDLLHSVGAAARQAKADIVLTGILPSLRKSDMGLENMTPLPRYAALNRSTEELRGGAPLNFRIKGVDELAITHDSVMLEACNASFQVHLQVDPDRFARAYNAAQGYSAPVLAAAANSPLLFGRRLWQETRIALFQQAVDTRSGDREHRESPARVHFGRAWVKESVAELFREDITRYRVLMSVEPDEDPFEVLDRGDLPQLKALRLHNGTVWRWNRPCYGITDGKAHLRIENRILPSGPTPVDEIANAAFWLGLMSAADSVPDFAETMDFESAKENFLAAARQGLSAQFTWHDGRTVPAQKLILEELIPLAHSGLEAAGVDAGDRERYLGVIEERVASERTGARWLLSSMAEMKGTGTATERLSALTRAVIARQFTGEPVHRWEPARLEEAGGWKRHYVRVEQYMTTDLFTVQEEDSVDFVASLMDWEQIRHIPVEDGQHKLKGLISYRSLLRIMARGETQRDGKPVAVTSIMKKDPLTIPPDTETLDAIELMRKNSVSCLPVVKEGRLVGIVTERDFMVITRELLYQKFKA